MKNGGLFLLAFLLITGCKSKHVPEVSGINIDLKVQRFEKDFFALDTIQTNNALQQLHQKYPDFLQDFIFNIVALPSQPDSSKELQKKLAYFIRSYKSLNDATSQVFADFDDVAKEVKHGLQFVKYYFPDYKLPHKLITFIGPIDSYGNILMPDALAVGLQLYMGKNNSLYQSEIGQALYPAYISRRFEKAYIPVNCMKNIVDDLFADNSAGKPLLEQMVQSGKRLYVLDHLLPETADSLKTGYTDAQLQGAYKNEATIWSYFVQNDLLYSTDPTIIKDYMNDGPKTLVFGDASPGFIGQFVGWQIVKKWMDKNEKLTLIQLMQTEPKKIFTEAKYKP